MSALRTLGRPLRRASASVDRTMTHAETRAVLRQRPVVVLSMGKTGTTSLTTALEDSGHRPVVKAHAVSREGIAARRAKAARLGIVSRPRFLWGCESIAGALSSGGRWELICGVRDPIALAVSDHFYGLQGQREAGMRPWVDEHDEAGHVEAVVENLRTNFIEIDWFDQELLPISGIDVYRTPFPHDRGTVVLEHGRFRALVVRAEDLPRTGSAAVTDFLRLPSPLVIERHNEGTRRDPDSAYHRFVDRGRLPASIVETVYAEEMARHFYTDEERADLVRRWTGVRV